MATSSSPEFLVSHTVGGGATTATDDKSTGACSNYSEEKLVVANHKAENTAGKSDHNVGNIKDAAHQKAEITIAYLPQQ